MRRPNRRYSRPWPSASSRSGTGAGRRDLHRQYRPADLSGINSRETYFGSDRNEYLGNGTQGQQGTKISRSRPAPQLNTLHLGGTWDIEPKYAGTNAVPVRNIE